MSQNASQIPSCRPSPDAMTDLILVYCFQGAYGVSSVFVYIMNIRALRFYKSNLDKTFSLLYICCAILSIIYFLDHFLIRRFLKLGYFCEFLLENFGEPNFWMNPYKTVASYCPIAILVFHSLIASHRFSIVVSPIIGVQAWEQYRKPAVIVGFLIPLIFMWFMIPTKSFAQLDPEGDGLDIEYKKVVNLSSSLFACIAAVIFGILTLGFTLGMFAVLSQVNLRKISPTEVSLIIFEVLMTIFTLVYASVQGVLYYSIYIAKDMEMKAVVINFRTFAIDIFILPQAWTLLFLSKTVRRYFLRYFGKKVGIQVNSTTMDQRKITRVVSPAQRTTSRL